MRRQMTRGQLGAAFFCWATVAATFPAPASAGDCRLEQGLQDAYATARKYYRCYEEPGCPSRLDPTQMFCIWNKVATWECQGNPNLDEAWRAMSELRLDYGLGTDPCGVPEAPPPSMTPAPKPGTATPKPPTPPPSRAPATPRPPHPKPAPPTAVRPQPYPRPTPLPIRPGPPLERPPRGPEERPHHPGKKGKLIRLSHRTDLELVWIPGGRIWLGCAAGDTQCRPDEKPRYRREIKGFWIGRLEVTQRQWKAVMKRLPSSARRCPQCPVTHVSWSEVKQFLRKASHGLRLPSEAEWEYAARGGLNKSRYGPNSKIAWCSGKGVRGAKRGGLLIPNPYGVYDMLGNVWEWTSDFYGIYDKGFRPKGKEFSHSRQRVIRGGSWKTLPRICRASHRESALPATRRGDLGFRVAKSKGKGKKKEKSREKEKPWKKWKKKQKTETGLRDS